MSVLLLLAIQNKEATKKPMKKEKKNKVLEQRHICYSD